MVGLFLPAAFLGNLYRCRISSFVPVRPSDIRALLYLLELALPWRVITWSGSWVRIFLPQEFLERFLFEVNTMSTCSSHWLCMNHLQQRVWHSGFTSIESRYCFTRYRELLPDRRTNSGSVQVLTLQLIMVCSIHIMLITAIHSTGILVTSILHLPWTRFLSSFHCFCPVSPGAMESQKYQLHETAINHPGLERMLLQRFSSRGMCTMKKSDD